MNMQESLQKAAADHRRQTAWQVWVPLVVAILAVVALAVLAAMFTMRDADFGTRWSSISLILLILPAMIAGFVFLALIGLMIYGSAKVLNILPPKMEQLSLLFDRISLEVKERSNQAVKPVLAVQGVRAGWQRLLWRLGLRRR